MKFFEEDYIKNLPDCYSKKPDSNNYKLMQLLKYDAEKFHGILQELEENLSLDDATGHALNLYGEMYGQQRGEMTDEQYRLAIRQKMAIYRCKSDYNNIVNVLSFAIGSPVENFLLEDGEIGGTVDIKMFPYDNLQKVGITVPQAWQMVETLLPGGVRSSGFNITHEVNEETTKLSSAVTFAERYRCAVACRFYESIEAGKVTAASAATHAEYYSMEVLN